MDNPETTLARRFQDIDGPHSRRDNLTHLVKALSPWERRHLRLQLGDRDGLANFEDAPLDLVHLLAPHLFLEDVLACMRVSRRCRASWGDESIIVALSARFFPGLPRPLTFDLFLKTCKRYFIRRAGRYTRMLEVQLARQASIPFDPRWMPEDPNPNYLLSHWYRDAKEQFAADPKVHADGSFPAPWPDMPTCGFGCYGGGNVVWLAGPNFVVDNMYTRTRRVVSFSRSRSVLEAPEAPALPYYSNSGASKSLVVFYFAHERRLLIYHLDTDTLTRFSLPTGVLTMAVRGRRVFLVMFGWQVCVLEHDGARVLTKYHFKASEGIQEEVPGLRFSRTGAWPQIYVHPHIEDRFFVAMCGAAQDISPVAISGTTGGHEEQPLRRVQYFVVREYDGAKHVATYLHDVLGREVDEMARLSGSDPANIQLGLMKDLDLLSRPGSFQDSAPALDDFGLFSVRQFWQCVDPAEDMVVEGLPPHQFNETNYVLHTTFNVITKEFGFERYFSPFRGPYKQAFAPWNQQILVPTVVMGDMVLRKFDAEHVYRRRTALPMPPDLRGERLNSSLTAAQPRPLSIYLDSACWLHQDSDFTVLFIEGLNRYIVWSFVE